MLILFLQIISLTNTKIKFYRLIFKELKHEIKFQYIQLDNFKQLKSILFQMEQTNSKQIQQRTKRIDGYEQRLNKMKILIESRQQKINFKKSSNESPIDRQKKQIIPLYQASIQNLHTLQNDFKYNSTLFRQLNNDSQPILENESGMTNFSVSNINNLLNKQTYQPQLIYPGQSTYLKNQENLKLKPAQDHLMDQINNILEKVSKTVKFPTKSVERYLNNKERPISVSEEGDSFRYSYLSEYQTQHDQYSKLNENQAIYRIKEQDYINQDSKIEKKRQQIKKKQLNKKDGKNINEKSHMSNQNQIFKSQHKNRSLHPQIPKDNSSTIERQKIQLRETIQQQKKLFTENSDLNDSQINFELSDEEQKSNQKSERISRLLNQKSQLKRQLQQIEQELKQLQNDF